MAISRTGIFCIFFIIVLAFVSFGIVLFTITCRKDFPEDFKFGAATSSYQIEGAWNVGEKSENMWDIFTHEHSYMILDKSNGDVAADSYHLYREDIEAARKIGLNFYRFSVSWARIFPDEHNVNSEGIEYYNNLINELLDYGIEPMLTIFHWDLPQYIQKYGGFTNASNVVYFEKYADILFKHFGDRVKMWITINEPWVFCVLGHGIGIHAPMMHNLEYECGHNVLDAHARAFRLYKRNYARTQKGEIGISLVSHYFYPFGDEGPEFAEWNMEFMLGWFAHPTLSKEGGYPQVMVDLVKENSEKEGLNSSRLPEMSEEMRRNVQGSYDFVALNYYTARYVKKVEDNTGEKNLIRDLGGEAVVDPTWPHAEGIYIYSVPTGLYDLLMLMKNKYNNPKIYITENGWSDDGQLNDIERINYIRDHLWSVSKAIKDECNVKAYTVWSLIDNFEWSSGYKCRFGLVQVNFNSTRKERTLKDSAEFYANVIANRKI